ncbi:MAG: U32 family peptidase [Cyanobacteria bacterium P01_E01_bin.34]
MTVSSSQPGSVQPSLSSHCRRPELLAPAGDWDCAKAAVENGADAIYFGLNKFNARMRAHNFAEGDLAELIPWLHLRGVKAYVTFNTLTFANELPQAEQYLRAIIAAGVDAAIVQDVGICRLIRHLSPDFPIHASTQMTVTSSVGVQFAKSLGCNLVVLARECSLKDINKIQQQLQTRDAQLPLEVFVHGALCVAYSGQCLTSEALGGRSANRGECAQACRMTYELISDGKTVPLADRQYLLSPQDLSGLSVLPKLVKSGVASLKIEGRLKTPEYVANVSRVYREALDRVTDTAEYGVKQSDRYSLEMSFSRGLYTGWMNGINNQELVHARFGKKRGVYLGRVSKIKGKKIAIQLEAPLKAGDGVVFDCGTPQQNEEGGRIYSVQETGQSNKVGKLAWIGFGRDAVDWRRVHVGDRLWKTSDPELERSIRHSFAGDAPKFSRPIDCDVFGEVGEPLTIVARDRIGHTVTIQSEMPLVEAHSTPLDEGRLRKQLGRLGGTPFELGTLTAELDGAVMLPVSELNRMRRSLVEQLEKLRARPHRWQLHEVNSYQDLLPANPYLEESESELVVLARSLDQLEVAWTAGIKTLYCEFEDPRAYREAVRMVKSNPTSADQTIWVAPPRIAKPLENWILQQVKTSNADGYLVRNYDHLEYFKGDRCIGDFSLNVANPITARHYIDNFNLERLTASYDLNTDQLAALLTAAPSDWFELTIHQHMPMFHMEHCVFCAFLSDGTDFTNCGRPCETHQVKLRDRVGTEHVLQADAGCRNTLFNGTAQTGAEYVHQLQQLGARRFRIEFLDENKGQVRQAIARYQQLLNGEIKGAQLWRELQLESQLGVTRGPLDRH